MKRLFDIICSGLGLLLFFPFGIIIALILRFTGEGEVFYRQQRIGKGGIAFGILKYATMLKNSPNLGTGTITTKGDPRVLPMGKFLRKTKLNEVPQLWNIFVGDMSVVGPRPLTKETRDYIPEETVREIENLQPGLTGVGSIVFRDEESVIHESGEDYHTFYKREIAPYKGTVEKWYGEHQTFLLDMKLILLTAWVVFFPKSQLPKKWLKGLPLHPIFFPG
jgi:lipopolysaccharide/colanic/teichoic acid biosynthesis glycosyltransferase